MGAKTGWPRLGLWTMGAEKCINRVSTLSLHISTQSLLLVGSLWGLKLCYMLSTMAYLPGFVRTSCVIITEAHSRDESQDWVNDSNSWCLVLIHDLTICWDPDNWHGISVQSLRFPVLSPIPSLLRCKVPGNLWQLSSLCIDSSTSYTWQSHKTLSPHDGRFVGFIERD